MHKAVLQLEENKAEHGEPCLPFLFRRAAFLHRALWKPTITTQLRHATLKRFLSISVLAHLGVIKLPCMKVSVPEPSHYYYFFSS